MIAVRGIWTSERMDGLVFNRVFLVALDSFQSMFKTVGIGDLRLAG